MTAWVVQLLAFQLPEFTMFWSYGPFTVVSHSLFKQLVPRVVEFIFLCCNELGILGF